MTTRELEGAVSALCFYDIGERDRRFIAYANLALKAIYKELNILSRITIKREDAESGELGGTKGECTYNMRELVQDFQSFFLPPTDGGGRVINGAQLTDGRLTVKDYGGDCINVTYRKMPRRIYIDFPDEMIDIPEEHTELLSILCAYFLCLEDDREAAEKYKELYSRLISSYKANSEQRLGTETVRTNGWA